MRRKSVKNRFAPVSFGRTVYDEIWFHQMLDGVLLGRILPGDPVSRAMKDRYAPMNEIGAKLTAARSK